MQISACSSVCFNQRHTHPLSSSPSFTAHEADAKTKLALRIINKYFANGKPTSKKVPEILPAITQILDAMHQIIDKSLAKRLVSNAAAALRSAKTVYDNEEINKEIMRQAAAATAKKFKTKH